MKINKIYLIVFVFLLIKYNTCISQQFKSTSNTDEPIEIYADNGIEWHKNSKKYVRQLKKSAPNNKVIVSGCDAHIEKEMYLKMPEVDVVVGNDVKLDEAIWREITKSGRIGFFGKTDEKSNNKKTKIMGKRKLK